MRKLERAREACAVLRGKKMKTIAVVGTQWGDEGKGKIVDLLAADADVIVRFQGGNNAAHTLVVEGEKFILRLVPAGALYSNKTCVIGNGTVVDPLALLSEIDDLKKRRGLADDFLKLSYEAHIVFPYHRAIDLAREARAGKRAIGTTGFGIGPAYEDKMSRAGLRFDDLVNFQSFAEKLRRNVADKNAYLKAVLKSKPLNGADMLEAMRRARRRLMPTCATLESILPKPSRPVSGCCSKARTGPCSISTTALILS